MPAALMPRKVALTTDAVGGVWTYTLDLGSRLARFGVEVQLIVLGPQPSLAQQEQVAAIDGVRLLTLGLPLDWTAADRGELHEASRSLFAICRSLGVDMVHLNSPGLAVEAPDDLPLVVGLHSCVASWWRTMRPGDPMPPDLAWREERVSRALKRADAIAVPSRAFGRLASELYGPDLPLRTIHNGSDIQVLPGRRSETTAVFSAGRLWDEAKNIETLDAAAARLSHPVHVAGPLTSPDGASGACWCGNLISHGELSSADLLRHLGNASVFAAPARYEPFGLAVLEAARSGCALVLSDIPTFRELWDGAALFINPDDADALAAQLQHLCDDEASRDVLAQAAKERSQCYSLEAMADRTGALYAAVSARIVPESAGATA